MPAKTVCTTTAIPSELNDRVFELLAKNPGVTKHAMIKALLHFAIENVESKDLPRYLRDGRKA